MMVAIPMVVALLPVLQKLYYINKYYIAIPGIISNAMYRYHFHVYRYRCISIWPYWRVCHTQARTRVPTRTVLYIHVHVLQYICSHTRVGSMLVLLLYHYITIYMAIWPYGL